MTSMSLTEVAQIMRNAGRAPVPFSVLFKALSERKIHATPEHTEGIHKEVKGNVFFFEPLPGIYYGSCGPCSITTAMEDNFHCDIPIYMALLVVEGEMSYTLFRPNRPRTLDLVQHSFMIARWNNCKGLKILPLQQHFCHVAIMIRCGTFAELFGQAAMMDMDRIIDQYGDQDATGNATAVGLASKTSLGHVNEMLEQQACSGNTSYFFRCATLNFFAKLSQDLTKKSSTVSVLLHDYERNQLRKIKQLVDTHYMETPAIKKLCDLVGMSVSKAGRGFKKQYGISISQYITACKMEKAYTLLRERRCNVSESAYQVGYSNVGHFINAFKKTYGLTPRQVAETPRAISL